MSENLKVTLMEKPPQKLTFSGMREWIPYTNWKNLSIGDKINKSFRFSSCHLNVDHYTWAQMTKREKRCFCRRRRRWLKKFYNKFRSQIDFWISRYRFKGKIYSTKDKKFRPLEIINVNESSNKFNPKLKLLKINNYKNKLTIFLENSRTFGEKLYNFANELLFNKKNNYGEINKEAPIHIAGYGQGPLEAPKEMIVKLKQKEKKDWCSTVGKEKIIYKKPKIMSNSKLASKSSFSLNESVVIKEEMEFVPSDQQFKDPPWI